MTRKPEPRVIDFRYVRTPDEEAHESSDYQAILTALRGGRPDLQLRTGPTTFTLDTDGKLHAHTRPVPEFRMRRARRILWECRQHPDWAHKPSMFFRHPSLKNVPYVVLKRLYQESEARDA